ncbi:MAG: AAA family ATPase [Erythrobacter sp.]|nr:AAA family ATPase [Erythrobacter sp.]
MSHPRFIKAFRIAVAGTHSTGKTTFMNALREEFEKRGLTVEYVHDSAAEARDTGFPILSGHTFESTAWLMARAMQLEMEATLKSQIILVDRPVHDALGYLLAALAHTDRDITEEKMARLDGVCDAWKGEYDLVFMTVMDPAVPVGEGRDDNAVFRALAGQKVAEVVNRFLPNRLLLKNGERHEAVLRCLAEFEARASG